MIGKRSGTESLRLGETYTHSFTKDKCGTVCALCKNLWSSKDKITSKYQICSLCGINVHTNCRSVVQSCIPCIENNKISYSHHFRLDNISGWLYVKVLHIYDVNVAPGTPMYAQIRLKHGTQCMRSLTAESGNNDCLWESDPDVPVQLSSLKLHLNQGHLSSGDFLKELQLEVEIWSSFLSFFDTCLATNELTVSPALLYPNSILERWFTLTNKVGTEGSLSEGKLLLSMSFQPTEIGDTGSLTSPKASTAATMTAATETPRPAATSAVVPSSGDRARSLSQLSQSSTSDAPVLMSSPQNKGTPPSKASSRNTTPGGDDGNIRRAHSNSASEASILEGMAEVEAAVRAVRVASATQDIHTARALQGELDGVRDSSPTHLTNDPLSSAVESVSAHCALGQADDLNEETELAVEEDAIPTVEAVTTALPQDAAPVTTDFYQTIAEFTERTTNSIGTFFYEMEALNLSSSTKDAIDGDWSDSIEVLPITTAGSTTTAASIKSDSSKDKTDIVPILGVGYMHIRIISAFKSKIKDVADGDHYILATVEDSKREFKSKSVFRSATPIFNVRWTIKMEHYRAAVNVYLMDAFTHRRLAVARFSCYALMQRDADKHIPSYKEAPVENVALRGVSDNEEMGYLTAQVGFEEDLQHLFLGDNLHDAPTAPPELLSVQRLGVHIARFTAIIELFNMWYSEYVYIMEWREPFTTFVIFIVFLIFTLKVNAEYALSGVMFVIVALMTRTLLRRRSGPYVKHYVENGVKSVESKLDYKPIARLRVSVLGFRGRNSKTGEFSRSAMKVSYLPMAETPAEADGVSIEHTVGYFGNTLDGVGFAVPVTTQGVTQLVTNMVSSEVTQKDSVLQSVYDPWPVEAKNPGGRERDRANSFVSYEAAELALVYPVLQPISAKIQAVRTALAVKSKRDNISSPALGQATTAAGTAENNSSSSNIDHTVATSTTSVYLPWERNEAVVKLTFLDDQSSFGGPQEEAATLSVKNIVQHSSIKATGGKRVYEVKKWCKIMKRKVLSKVDSHSDLDLFAYDSASSIYMSSSDVTATALDTTAVVGSELAAFREHAAATPQGVEVLVRAQLEIPALSSLASPSTEERESSYVLQTLLKGDTEKESSTISVLWNMTDNVKYVQNLMNWLLDQIESAKNIFNWTAPNKTYPIYLAIIAVWLVTVVIPGRLLILAFGLYEFLFVLLPIPEGRSTMIRFGNLIQSIPNDDDIAQIYAVERKIFAADKQAEWKATEKARKVNLTMPTLWRGSVSVKASSFSGAGGSGSSGAPDEWIPVFMLLQGKRLVWWASEEALDQGKMAAGQLLLCGHAGLTQVSPVDLRKFGGDARLLAVFGQDFVGRPQKLSMLFSVPETRAELFHLLSSSSSTTAATTA